MTSRQLHPQHDQRGIALLLSLLLMAALTAAGIGASTVIINEFKTTASTDSGIGAFYAADVGIERSLFSIFNSRLTGVNLGESTYAPGSPFAFPMVRDNAPTMAPLVGATVDLTRTTINQSSKLVNIKKDQNVQLDLFSQTSQFNPSTTTGVARTLFLRSPNLSTLSPTAWVEVQWSYVRRSASNATPVPNSTIRLIAAKNVTDDTSGVTTCHGVSIDLLTGAVAPSDPACSITIENPVGITTSETTPSENDIAGYSVRIKALYADIPNLTIETRKSDSSAYLIPGDFNIVSRGESGNSRARLDASVPWKLPTSGLFDFVLFSESQLDKPGN